MFRYTGGQTVGHGFYWNARKWAVTLVERGGGTLPGDATERYARVPAAVMLVVAPVMGAVYVIFLPLIGFAMVLDFVGRRLWRAARKAISALAAALVPRWRPGEAYLAGREPKGERRAPKSGEPRETPKTEA